MEIVALPRHSVGGGPKVGGTGAPALRVGVPSDSTWQSDLRQAIRDPAQLVAALELPHSLIVPVRLAARQFPLFAPRPFVARMVKGDPADPLLLQVLPLAGELDSPSGFTADPVGDAAARQAAGLLHKYDGRALLITTGAR